MINNGSNADSPEPRRPLSLGSVRNGSRDDPETCFRVLTSALRYSNFLFEGDVERLMPHLERAMEILPQFGEVGRGKTEDMQQPLSSPTHPSTHANDVLVVPGSLPDRVVKAVACNSIVSRRKA